MFTVKDSKYNLRKKKQLNRDLSKTNRYGLNTFKDYGAKLWNNVPDNVKSKDLTDFKTWLNSWTG